MTNEEFRNAIIEALRTDPPLESYDILVSYKDGGGEQAKAYEILMGILIEYQESGVEEAVVDELCDIMDCVAGETANRVWPRHLGNP